MIQKDLLQGYFCDNWKDVIDKMKEGLMIVNLEGHILYVNKALEDMLLFRREELLGKACDILECDNCFGHNLSKEGKRCALFRKGDVSDLRCSFKKKNGERLQVLKNATVLTDEGGIVVAGVETLTDLTAVVDKDHIICALRKQLNKKDGFHGLIGSSAVMKKVYELITCAAKSQASIMLCGESGTGKELAANAIHRLSNRAGKNIVKVNCAALHEDILEGELFGYMKGGVGEPTGSGCLQMATGGSLFLDEVGDLPLAIQTKLLRVLQEQEEWPGVDLQQTAVGARVISATNKNMHALMVAGEFREDLYYRIGVLPITVPPLRQRLEDIPLLIETFMKRYCLKTGKAISSIRKDALELLMGYFWPGNIRELINVVEYAFVVCTEDEITPAHLPQYFHLSSSCINGHKVQRSNSAINKREQLLHILKETKGNKSEAARVLGISRVTLWKQLKKLNITVDKSAY